MLFSLNKEGNPAICDDMDELGEHYAKCPSCPFSGVPSPCDGLNCVTLKSYVEDLTTLSQNVNVCGGKVFRKVIS